MQNSRSLRSRVTRQSAAAQPEPGLSRTVSAPGRASAQPASKEDAKLREVILAEVLDTRPSVRWDDVAGLRKAKQVCLLPEVLKGCKP